jgi:hypothetical protein
LETETTVLTELLRQIRQVMGLAVVEQVVQQGLPYQQEQ